MVLVFSSANGEWSRQNSEVRDNLYGVSFLNENYGYAVGWGASSGGVILKTVNGGEEWTSSVPVQGSYLFSITSLDSLHGFAAGYNGQTSSAMLLETVDGGESWIRRVFRQSFRFYVVQFPTAEVGYVCGYGGAVFKSVDSGWNWDQLNTGSNYVFRNMHFVDDSTGYVSAGTSFNNTNMVYRTLNGGDDWEMVKNFGNSFVIGGIHFFDADTGIVVGNDGNESVYRTSDSGENWERVYNGNVRQVLQGVCFNGDQGWTFGGGGRIHRSVDASENWELDETIAGVEYWFDADEIGGSAYIVGTNGAIYKTDVEVQSAPSIGSVLPSTFKLYQNYPNPFNPTTRIAFDLVKPGLVSIEVFDIQGRPVRLLLDMELNSGFHTVNFDGYGLAQGLYYYRLKTLDGESMRKMILLK